jgi:hypothetical protein
VVPIALLEKTSLVHFDLRDERGGAVSLLSTAQNTRLSAAILTQLAHRRAPQLMSPEAEQDIQLLVGAGLESERQSALNRLVADDGSLGSVLGANPAFSALASDLASILSPSRVCRPHPVSAAS